MEVAVYGEEIGIETRASDGNFVLATVGIGVIPRALFSPSSSPARPSSPLLSSSFVLKICCTRGRLRYGRRVFPNVNRRVMSFDSLRASGGYVAVVPSGRTSAGIGGTMRGLASGLRFSSVCAGEESCASSRAPNVEMRLCPRRSDEDW